MEDSVFTTLAAQVLNLVYRGDSEEMAADYNQYHERGLTAAAVKRYCDGGQKYESGPPLAFKAWVLFINRLKLR